jgi:site-specific DNA-cytosine methylase
MEAPESTEWVIWDCYCGLGGFTAGALMAIAGSSDAVVSGAALVGVDCALAPLEMWKRNASKAPRVRSATSLCKRIGTDEIEWPDEDGRLIIHWSPCCQPFSKARAKPAEQSHKDSGLEQIRLILDLVVEKGYRRWSIEEVAHPEIVRLVQEYAARHPLRIAFDTLDAVAFGCPSERRRLIVSSAEMLRDLKSRTSTDYVSPKRAFAEAGIDAPASEFYRNGNVGCEPRPISRPSFTVTAGHPLVFCNTDRSLVRCMTPSESAALVGLPPGWELPRKVGEAQRGVGNVVAPPLAHAMVSSALAVELGPRGAVCTAQAAAAGAVCSAQAAAAGAFVTRAEVQAMIEETLRQPCDTGPSGELCSAQSAGAFVTRAEVRAMMDEKLLQTCDPVHKRRKYQ